MAGKCARAPWTFPFKLARRTFFGWPEWTGGKRPNDTYKVTHKLIMLVSKSTHVTSPGGSYRSKYRESIPVGVKEIWKAVLEQSAFSSVNNNMRIILPRSLL